MGMKSSQELCQELHRRGWIHRPDPVLRELSGGVSSDILLLDDGYKRLVLKRALPKLRVVDDWQADTSRNFYEQQYIDYVSRLLPGAVPRIVERDPEEGFFLMEYLDAGFENWKSLLLARQIQTNHAATAGRMLGTIHRTSWNDDSARNKFATTANFFQLRIDPYLVFTGNKHPALQALFFREAERLASTSLALVHGDFSPKNILVSRGRLVLLDCEVAWFGDPAFDVAFLLNHFLLKSLKHRAAPQPYFALAETFWRSYAAELKRPEDHPLEERVARLWLMLLLARIDGKSPVEYLTDEADKEFVRTFVAHELPRGEFKVANVLDRWAKAL